MQVKCNFQLSFYQLDGNNLFVFCSYELSRRNLIDKLYHIQDRPHDQMSMSESVVVIKNSGGPWQISVQKMVKCISYKFPKF